MSDIFETIENMTGDAELETARDQQLYEEVQKDYHLNNKKAYHSLNLETTTPFLPVETDKTLKNNYDHGFWADVNDEFGLWWHGLALDDNEFTNTFMMGMKGWWQKPSDIEYNPHLNNQGYEKYNHLLRNVRNEEHHQHIKNQIDELEARRTRLNATERQFGPALIAGISDPINFLALPVVKGVSVAKRFVRGGAVVGGAVAGTEVIRRNLDPTSTAEESAFYIGGSFLLGGGLTAAIGKNYKSTAHQINKADSTADISLPELSAEKIHKADTVESGMPTFDSELDNNLIYNPRDYEPNITLLESELKENVKEFVPTAETKTIVELNNFMKNFYEKYRKSDIGTQKETFMFLGDKTPKIINKEKQPLIDENDRLAEILSSKRGTSILLTELKKSKLTTKFVDLASLINKRQKRFLGFNYGKLGLNEQQVGVLKNTIKNEQVFSSTFKKEIKNLENVLVKMDDIETVSKLQTKQDMYKQFPATRYMEKLNDSMKSEKVKGDTLDEFFNVDFVKESIKKRIEKIRDQLKQYSSGANIKQKTLDDFYKTFHSNVKINKKLTPEEMNKVAIMGYGSGKNVIDDLFLANKLRVQEFKKYLQEQVESYTKKSITKKNTRSKFVKYNKTTGVMIRDTNAIKRLYDEKGHLKSPKGIDKLPSSEFRSWLDYLDFRTHKEILRKTRFIKQEQKLDDIAYENALNKKTLDELRVKKEADYTEDIPFWARQVSQFQSDYGFVTNLKDKLPNIKSMPLIGAVLTRLSGSMGVPNRLARHNIVAPPSALAEINTTYLIKYREAVMAIDNAYVRVNMSNNEPSTWLDFNISKASLKAREMFMNAKNKVQEKAGKSPEKARTVSEEQVNEAIGRAVIDKKYRSTLPSSLEEAVAAVDDYFKFIDGKFKKYNAYVSSGGYLKVIKQKEARAIEIGKIIQKNNAKKEKLPEEALNELKIKRSELLNKAEELKKLEKQHAEIQEIRKKSGLKDFTEDYFYRVWKLDVVESKKDELIKILVKHYEENQTVMKPFMKKGTDGESKMTDKLADMQGYRGIYFNDPEIISKAKKPKRKFISLKDKKAFGYKGKKELTFNSPQVQKFIDDLESKGIKVSKKEAKSGETIIEKNVEKQVSMPKLTKKQIKEQAEFDYAQIWKEASKADSMNVDGFGINNLGKYVSGRTTLMSRKIDIPNSKILDFIQLDARTVLNNYRQKVTPAAAIMEQFGDHHLDDALTVLEVELIAKDLGRTMTKQDVDDVITSIGDTKDKMLGMYNLQDAASLNKRVATFFRDWASLAYMGKVLIAALPDIGKLVMSQGFSRTFGKGVGSWMKQLDNYQIARDNNKKAGIAMDLILGSSRRRFIEETGATAYGAGKNPLEKTFNTVAQKFNDWQGPWYLLNGLSFHTQIWKEMTGVLASDNFIRLSIKAAKGTATEEEMLVLLRANIDLDTAKIIAKSPYEMLGPKGDVIKGIGSRKVDDNDILYTANVDEWTGPGGQGAATRYRQALWSETNRTIVTPDVSDTPAMMSGAIRIKNKSLQEELDSPLGRFMGYKKDQRGGKIHNAALSLPFQFFSWGVAANRKIVMSGLSGREADYLGGITTMIFLGYMADYFKNPRYHAHKSGIEQAIRAVELSGIGGMITDMNFLTEQISGGMFNFPIGLRPLLGVEPRFGQPTVIDAVGEMTGAGPSIPLDLLYHFMSDDVTFEQRQNITRRVLPGATLIWTENQFKKVYNATTDVMFR